MPALEETADDSDEVRPGVTRYRLGEREVYVLSGGALVNIAGGLGHPIEIMDATEFDGQNAGTDFPPVRPADASESGLRAEELKEYLRRLNPEDFGRFSP